ncbi:MAG TPA: ABC transporter permease [Blastocatellia bacterium]|nr:ABC transporter permease [Blastocatellia bacterium]
MKRIIAQARKELTQTFRDRLTVALALVLPLVLIVLIGAAISLSVKNVPVTVQDFDRTPLSRRYIDAVRTSITFRVVPVSIDQQPDEALVSEHARAAIVIPKNFEQDFLRGRTAEVQWLIDATDSNTANALRGSASSITRAFQAQLDPGDSKTAVKPPAVKAEMRMWYNPGVDSDKYIGPAVFAVVLALFPPLLAALATSREGEQKTILQVYVSSISATEFLLGKIAAFFVIALAEWALALVLSIFFFDLTFVGDPTPLLVGTVFYLFCTVSFGVMVGCVIPNQATAIQAVAFFGFLLSFLLSGFVFPVSNVPAAIRWIAGIVPARYFIEIARDTFVRGGGWPAVWHAPVMLAIIGAFFFLLAWRKMRHMQVES